MNCDHGLCLSIGTVDCDLCVLLIELSQEAPLAQWVVRQSHNLKVVSSILTGGIFGNPVMKSVKPLLYNYGKL